MLADYRSAALLQTKAASLNFLQRYIEVSDIIAPGFCWSCLEYISLFVLEMTRIPLGILFMFANEVNNKILLNALFCSTHVST